MKKFIFLLLVLSTYVAPSQNKKIYISKQGGKPRLLYFGKLGYNTYMFNNRSGERDSLVCSGFGWERCRLEKKTFPKEWTETRYYDYFNYAIKKTEKQIKRKKNASGELVCTFRHQKLIVRYSNADKKGNAEMEIELL